MRLSSALNALWSLVETVWSLAIKLEVSVDHFRIELLLG